MKKFRVQVREENWGWVEVEAKNAEAAEELVRDQLDEMGRSFWMKARDMDGETCVQAEESA
jgi:hypothetical protein